MSGGPYVVKGSSVAALIIFLGGGAFAFILAFNLFVIFAFAFAFAFGFRFVCAFVTSFLFASLILLPDLVLLFAFAACRPSVRAFLAARMLSGAVVRSCLM